MTILSFSIVNKINYGFWITEFDIQIIIIIWILDFDYFDTNISQISQKMAYLKLNKLRFLRNIFEQNYKVNITVLGQC